MHMCMCMRTHTCVYICIYIYIYIRTWPWFLKPCKSSFLIMSTHFMNVVLSMNIQWLSQLSWLCQSQTWQVPEPRRLHIVNTSPMVSSSPGCCLNGLHEIDDDVPEALPGIPRQRVQHGVLTLTGRFPREEAACEGTCILVRHVLADFLGESEKAVDSVVLQMTLFHFYFQT